MKSECSESLTNYSVSLFLFSGVSTIRSEISRRLFGSLLLPGVDVFYIQECGASAVNISPPPSAHFPSLSVFKRRNRY